MKAALVLLCAAAPVLSSHDAAAASTVSAVAVPSELTIGSPLAVSGRVDQGVVPPVTALSLQADPYPYRAFTTIARTVSAADGSYSFRGVRLQQNTRLRVTLTGATPASSEQMTVTIDPLVTVQARSLGLGRVRLSIRIRHVEVRRPSGTDLHWYLAPRAMSMFRPSVETRSHETAPGVSYSSAVVDPPSPRFAYRVCLNPVWERAMGEASSHGSCPAHAFRLPARAHASLEFGGEGRGRPLAAFPAPGAVAAAARFLAGRAGRTSFAVVDSSGRLSGLHTREHFQTASVVKVMMLVAYLQMVEAHHRALQPGDESLLYPMIHESNNEDASAVLARIGESAVERVAREAGMVDYAPGIGWWAYSQSSAADQARFFAALGRLTPPRLYPYERGLMAGIEPEQSWGVPPVARPGWQVFFKTGALPSEGLFTEVARLERPGVTFTVAVFTDGEPSMSYGEQTIEGVAAALLAHAP